MREGAWGRARETAHMRPRLRPLKQPDRQVRTSRVTHAYASGGSLASLGLMGGEGKGGSVGSISPVGTGRGTTDRLLGFAESRNPTMVHNVHRPPCYVRPAESPGKYTHAREANSSGDDFPRPACPRRRRTSVPPLACIRRGRTRALALRRSLVATPKVRRSDYLPLAVQPPRLPPCAAPLRTQLWLDAMPVRRRARLPRVPKRARARWCAPPLPSAPRRYGR